jgi:hypothetical protein
MKKTRPDVESFQISLFSPQEARIAEKLRNLDLNSITPIEALRLLGELKDGL